MDERQAQIKEGAGLEESRVNVEFVDFLKKWSTPALLVVAAIVVGMFALRKLEERRQSYLDAAFAQYESAARPKGVGPDTAPLTSVVAISPFTLQGVAEEYGDVKGARWLSRLAAADTYMTAVRTGVTLGATVMADGTVADPEQDLLGPEARTDYLEQARSLYRAVLQDTENDPNATIHTIRALFGIAAVQESAGELEGARQSLDRVATLAAARGFGTLARLAERRIQTLDSLETPVELVSSESLPELPWLAPPPPPAPEQPREAPPGAPGDESPFGPILPPALPGDGAAEPGDGGSPASGDAGGGG
ncbi:MAG: hypothetical protein ACF8R7_07960 [Phycisphaerales bacterium JB039]